MKDLKRGDFVCLWEVYDNIAAWGSWETKPIQTQFTPISGWNDCGVAWPGIMCYRLWDSSVIGDHIGSPLQRHGREWLQE